jgi:hypothetical protein
MCPYLAWSSSKLSATWHCCRPARRARRHCQKHGSAGGWSMPQGSRMTRGHRSAGELLGQGQPQRHGDERHDPPERPVKGGGQPGRPRLAGSDVRPGARWSPPGPDRRTGAAAGAAGLLAGAGYTVQAVIDARSRRAAALWPRRRSTRGSGRLAQPRAWRQLNRVTMSVAGVSMTASNRELRRLERRREDGAARCGSVTAAAARREPPRVGSASPDRGPCRSTRVPGRRRHRAAWPRAAQDGRAWPLVVAN